MYLISVYSCEEENVGDWEVFLLPKGFKSMVTCAHKVQLILGYRRLGIVPTLLQPSGFQSFPCGEQVPHGLGSQNCL